MNLFSNMLRNSDGNSNHKEIDMRLFFTKCVNGETPLPPFTRNYHFSYVKRDY